MGSFRQEEAASGAHLTEEEQLLVLEKTQTNATFTTQIQLRSPAAFPLPNRSDASVVSPLGLLLLPLPRLHVLLPWEGHGLETRHAPRLRLIGLGD